MLRTTPFCGCSANVDQLLATILVVNNLVNICIVILGRTHHQLCSSRSARPACAFSSRSVIATFLLLLFGEIHPQGIRAEPIPCAFARTVARPHPADALADAARFAYILIRTSSTHQRTRRASSNEISLDELADAVDMTATASAPRSTTMLSGIVKFANTEVQEIMRPRVDVVAVGIGGQLPETSRNASSLRASRASRSTTRIWTISRESLYVKDLLPYINNGDEFGWQQLLRKAYFVPEHKKINDLLDEFQSNKVHMAVVVDEYGSTLGHGVARRYSSKRSSARFRTRATPSRAPTRKLDDRRATSSTARPTSATSNASCDIAREHLRRRQGRGRDAGGADARTQARLSAQRAMS